jgi:hypothetical protein
MNATISKPRSAKRSNTAIDYIKSRTYKKHEAKADVERWSEIFPWYKNLVEDIQETLAARDGHCGGYTRARQ